MKKKNSRIKTSNAPSETLTPPVIPHFLCEAIRGLGRGRTTHFLHAQSFSGCENRKKFPTLLIAESLIEIKLLRFISR